ncbi:hypothetical protein BGX34_010000, partial [Mortierella sp. NVP85]
MRVALLLSTLALAVVTQASSYTGIRTLVLLDSPSDGDSYEQLWSDLKDREYNVTLHDVNSPIALIKHGERLYDQLVILSAKMK